MLNCFGLISKNKRAEGVFILRANLQSDFFEAEVLSERDQPGNSIQNQASTQTKTNVPKVHSEIHFKAVAASRRYKKSESELIEIFEQIERHKTYFYYECSSLSQYGVEQLSLSKDVVYNFIQIMRASKKAPALKAELNAGTITLSNAKRIAPVINFTNQTEWIKKALTLSSRALEKEIVKVRPKSATREQVSYVTESRMKLELGLFEKDMLELRHAQDLVSQAGKKAATLEDTLIEMTRFFLKHKDPLLKAKRVKAKKGLNQATKKPLTQNTAQLVARRVRTQNTENANEKNISKSEAHNENEDTLKASLQNSNLNPTSFTNSGSHSSPNSNFNPNSNTNPNSVTILHSNSNPQANLDANQNPRPNPNLKNQSPFFKRTPIPSHILHQVNLRDQRQCAYQNQKHTQKGDQKDSRCKNTRWLEIHHKIPVSAGGENTLENLITLCSAHHDWIHR